MITNLKRKLDGDQYWAISFLWRNKLDAGGGKTNADNGISLKFFLSKLSITKPVLVTCDL